MAVTQTELKSSFLRNILEEEEYQSNVKALQDWLTGATQAATQQYQATAQTAAEQASYDISGAYANYLKQQRAVTAQGQLESGHKEEIGDVLQQQYQGAYSQARTAQAQTVAKAQEQYGENISYATQLYEKDKKSLLDAAIKEADLRANIFKAAEQYAGLTDYTQNITALGADIRDASGNVIGTGKGIYDIDTTTGEHTLTKYGTNVFRQALLQDEGFINYLEEEGLTDELDYYLSDTAGLHKTLFGFTETDYGISEESKKAIAEATLGTKGYAETITKPTTGLKNSDFSAFAGTSKTNVKLASARQELIAYAESLGLDKGDYGEILTEYDRMSSIVNTKEGSKQNLGAEEVENLYQSYLNDLMNISKYKYGVTTTAPERKYSGGRTHVHK